MLLVSTSVSLHLADLHSTVVKHTEYHSVTSYRCNLSCVPIVSPQVLGTVTKYKLSEPDSSQGSRSLKRGNSIVVSRLKEKTLAKGTSFYLYRNREKEFVKQTLRKMRTPSLVFRCPRIGAMKQFAKAFPEDDDCFKYLCEKFPGLSEKGNLCWSRIRKLMKDKEFETSMTTKDTEAWVDCVNIHFLYSPYVKFNSGIWKTLEKKIQKLATEHKKVGVYCGSLYLPSHIKLRNPDGCSVFRSELITIDTGRKEALSIPGSNSIWILSDSRSAIQHFSNWHKADDNTGVDILRKLKHLSSSREIHLQLVLLHVNIASNEIANSVAKDKAAQHTMNSAALTYSELHSTYINSKQTTIPPAHHWYEAKRPGGSLFVSMRQEGTNYSDSFSEWPLRTWTFRDGNKVFPTCVRCSASQASPEHILDCLGLTKQDLYEDPLMVLDFLRVNGSWT
ncbi:RNase H domain-containing protein [Trichonephila clavipes]|nr:RNase H domain-containing protein [Trichonephila clavipes]